MKTRILMSVLAIGLSIALIGGATMAWFTDEADVPEATFTAGTVDIEVTEGETFISGLNSANFDNVNPGDEYEVNWTIKNMGTKDAEIRIFLEAVWEPVLEGDLLNRLLNEFGIGTREDLKEKLKEEIGPVIDYEIEGMDDYWEIYKDGEDKSWLYYVGGPLDGTYGREEEEVDEIELTLEIEFVGEKMDNKYMGATFTVDGLVEAIQASNDAPAEVWGGDWAEQTEEE